MAEKIVVVAALIGNHRREEEKSCFTRHRKIAEPEEKTIGGENEFITLCRKSWKLDEQN